MALKTFVKVSGITNLSDARYCAGMGADLLGFGVIEGQENFIRSALFQEIRGWVTGPKVVAEIYGLTDPGALSSILENYRPDFLELSLTEFSILPELPLPFILSLKEGEVPKGSPEYVLIPAGFTGPLLTSVNKLVCVGNKEEADQVLNQSAAFGIVLKGGTELRPGIKEYEDLSEIFEMLETED